MSKTEPYLDRCRCCLRTGKLNELWSEFVHDGQREIYGEVLVECFAISLQPTEYKEQICNSCVTRLQDAFRFRKLILASDEHLSNGNFQVKPGAEYTSKVEDISSLKKKKDMKEEKIKLEIISEGDSIEENVEYILCDEGTQEEEPTIDEGDYIIEKTITVQQGDGVEYLEMEYLDEGEKPGDVQTEPEVKRKWPKKRKKNQDRTTNIYKKYTEEDLRKALEAVRGELMTRSEAAAFYNVPVKTIGAKIRAEECRNAAAELSNDDEDKIKSDTKQTKFIEEIKTILTYTNGTPFKSKASKYFCAYCTTNGPCFENPDDLRSHSRTQHVNDRLKGVEVFMRPQFLNEVLKLDIQNLMCSICCSSLAGWNDMFQHLLDKHEVELEQAYNKIIPFKLTEELSCALCNEKFQSFSLIDSHMNAHYNNYICGECGDTFLAENRLKKHVDTHRVGKFICNYCDKVFSLEKYRKKHIEGVHGDDAKFKCRHCPEKFKLEYSRHLHEITDHDVKARSFTCSFCTKTFDWRPYYLKHVRLMHRNAEKKHQCKQCGKNFKMPYELKNHEAWHTGGNVCQMCGKKFSSKQYLSKHLRTHVGDIVSISYAN